VSGKNAARYRTRPVSVEALGQGEGSSYRSSDEAGRQSGRSLGEGGSQSRRSLGEGGSLVAEPPASLTTNQNSLSVPAIPATGTISTVEEWRPQPRKRVRELVDSGSSTDDLSVSFPEANRIIFYGPSYFASWESGISRRFAELSLGIREVRELEIDTINKTATLSLVDNGKKVLRKIVEVYRGNRGPDFSVAYSPKLTRVVSRKIPRVRLFRYGKTITTWELRVSLPGWIRLRHALVLNKVHLVEALERELLGLMGIEEFRSHRQAGSISITYDPSIVSTEQIIRRLDEALTKVPKRRKKSVVLSRVGLPVATVSLGLSIGATFFFPVLLPVGTLLMLYTAIPSFRRAWDVLTKERRLGVDVLDSIIFSACLFTGQIFAGAMTAWFLSFGRKLLKQTRADSARMLLQAFGKQPSYARVIRENAEVEVALAEVRRDDRVLVHTGEVIPVDGVVEEGDALIDQHALTGESAPAEKSRGHHVFASTVMLAGRIIIRVERAGKDTASSKITAVLRRTVAYKLRSQSRGEDLADHAVVPALGLSTLAASLVDPSAALAVINSEMGTGIRMAAPLGLLNSLTLCAQQGILVKDGRALEMMRQIDVVLFDKTGTLTQERPEVGEIITRGNYTPEKILTLAATAEQNFSHPIAKAILERFGELGVPLLPIDTSQYQMGLGISVVIEGNRVRIGSRRFLELERIPVPPELQRELSRIHDEGNSFVCVAIGEEVVGVIELRAARRPEVEQIVKGLRARGIKHMAIISGDHEAPTRRLAAQLGMDRYFAEVLPQHKGDFVQLMQKEGHRVCFIGDGINDSIALKKADVSISLRGASSIATDTAQVVFMQESLEKLCAFVDISRSLEKNVQRSWHMILIPNGLCIAGVFIFGFNIWHSVMFNNASAFMALANGMLPLRKVRRIRELKVLSVRSGER
jgi:heavy metal translocating P-type ATPase